jgi:hypothetical protein
MQQKRETIMPTASAIQIALPGYPFNNLKSVANFAALRAIASGTLANGNDIAVDAGIAAGDGFGGLFNWSAVSVSADDGAKVIKPNDLGPLQAGRWVQSQSVINTLAADLSLPTGASLVNGIHPFSASIARTMASRNADLIPLFDFLPSVQHNAITTHTSTYDATAQLQALVDKVSFAGGGAIQMPAGTVMAGGLVMKGGVTLNYNTNSIAEDSSYNIGARIRHIGNSPWTIDSPSSLQPINNSWGIHGVNVYGNAAGGLIRVRSGNWWVTLSSMGLSACGEQAILQEYGSANVALSRVLVINAVRNRIRSQITGAVEILGTDSFLHRVEAGPSITSSEGTNGIISPNLYIAGILLGGTKNWAEMCLAEFSERGIHSTSPINKLIGCRSDYAWGHGLTGTGLFDHCDSFNSSLGANNTYDGFNTDGYRGGEWTACQDVSDGAANLPRFGWNGASSTFGPPVDRARVSGFRSSSAVSGWINQSLSTTAHDIKTLEVPFVGTLTATPSVQGYSTLTGDNTSAITVTNFVNGFFGKTIRLIGNSNITIANNANISTNTGANKVLVNDKVYTFIRNVSLTSGVKWFEVA